MLSYVIWANDLAVRPTGVVVVMAVNTNLLFSKPTYVSLSAAPLALIPPKRKIPALGGYVADAVPLLKKVMLAP